MDLKNLLLKNKEIDILANIPDGILVLDEKGCIDKANDKAAALFKYDRNLLSKADINDFIEGGFDLVKQTSLNGQSVVGKVKIESAKNSYFEITSQSVQNCFVVSLRDVTQSYKTITNLMIEQKSSKKNNKDKNKFLVKLSNELKSPLQSIVGFSQVMIDGLGGTMSEKQDKYVRIINKNSTEALYLMNKIIELAKTESNMFEYETQIFDVVNTSQVVAKEFEIQAKEKNLDWKFDASEITKKSIFSDEGAIKIILKNILEICLNMTDIGSISVKLCHPERDVVLAHNLEVPENEEDYNAKVYLMYEITDTSSGYSDVEKEDLFEPYLQLDKPNKKNIVRSIALASVKNLVKHLKGEIWVDSVSMEGSKYSVIIPIAR
ncbi:hypothetical protein IJ732_08025 [bacterium]|nr:hypothetical protein [bacterium]